MQMIRPPTYHSEVTVYDALTMQILEAARDFNSLVNKQKRIRINTLHEGLVGTFARFKSGCLPIYAKKSLRSMKRDTRPGGRPGCK